MSWLLSIVVAILTGVAGLFASGFVASLLVDWYHISSFEGGSGYFVVGLALLGGMAGALIGLITSRVVAARPKPSFPKALGLSLAVVVTILIGVGGTARLLADIPPEIDGETLFLVTEVRWPQSGAAEPASLPGPGVVQLGATSGSVVRVTEDGPLFLDRAHQENGRWVIPGAVRVFTSRGDRILDFRIGEKTLAGFIVPLPRHPGDESRAWSDWLPHARPGSPPLPDQFTYRYRIVRESEPIRTDTVGPFEVDVMSRGFFHVGGSDDLASSSTFRVRHTSGAVLQKQAQAVAVVGGARVALLVQSGDRYGAGPCQIVSDDNGQARVAAMGLCASPIDGRVLTPDTARFQAARARVVLPGWVDRTMFAIPGFYRVSDTVVDTSTLRTFTLPEPAASTPSPVPAVPPLDLSPDARSFVWFGLDGSEDQPRLMVTRIEDGAVSVLPIDPVRMRYIDFDALTPEWVHHHFAWQRRPEGDVLVERPDFKPLPYQGRVTLNKPGEYQAYTLRPGSEELRTAVVSLLTKELAAERLPDELDGYKQRVKIDGEILEITVSPSSSSADVTVSTYKGGPDLMKRVATRLDAAMATGQYDSLFTGRSRTP